MSARRVAVLLALAVIVIGFAIWLSSRRHLDRDLTAGELVLPGLEQQVNTVTTVKLQKGDGTRSTLTKSGATWSVTERGWPAGQEPKGTAKAAPKVVKKTVKQPTTICHWTDPSYVHFRMTRSAQST